MPVACSRCGTQNPDGNRFCQNCGTVLAAAPPVATQAAPTAPAPVPGGPAVGPPPAMGGYQNPYYAPAQPQQVHRTPWLLVVGIIVGLVLVMGACGVGIAIVVPKGNTNTNQTSGPKLGTPAPPAIKSSPSPVGQASPSPKPTPGQSSGGQTVSVASLTVSVPSGFQVIDKNDNGVTVQTPKGDGVIQVQSGKLSNPTTEQQLQQAVLAYLKQKYPDANVCGSDNNVEINGPSGSIAKICFTLTSQNSPAVAAAAVYWLATNSAHNVFYEVDGFTTDANFDSFMDTTSPFVDSVNWKLA